jgi:hypothetical protein
MLEKMGSLLSDPESVRELQELVRMLQQGESQPEEPKPPEEKGSSQSGGLDFGMLLRMQELMATMEQESSEATLLLALKPHLQSKRQKKVDQAVKLLKFYGLFQHLKESGMLQELF